MSILKKTKIKNNITICILYILNLLIIFSAVASLSSLSILEKTITTTIEENERKDMEEDIIAIKDSITFFETDHEIESEILSSGYFYDWYHQSTGNSAFRNGVKTFLYSVSNKELIWHVNSSSLDINELTFYSSNNTDGIKFDNLIHILRDSSLLDKYYIRDIEGKKYWVEWGYSPSAIRGFNNEEYIVDGKINEKAQGVFILSFKSQDNAFKEFNKAFKILDLVKIFVPALIVLSFITSLLMMFYIVFSQRGIESNIENLSSNN